VENSTRRRIPAGDGHGERVGDQAGAQMVGQLPANPAGSRRGKKSIVITFDSSTALLGTSVKLRCRP
jgi:hypothetical protein